MNKKDAFLEIMNFRYACKIFNETKKINDDNIHYILEIARKVSSSFGMEG